MKRYTFIGRAMTSIDILVDFDVSNCLHVLQSCCAAGTIALADAVRSDCNPYVPYDTGTLCESAFIQETEDPCLRYVIWDTPYASAVYYGDEKGVTFHKEVHPLASARWFERAKCAFAAAWQDTVEREMKKDVV